MRQIQCRACRHMNRLHVGYLSNIDVKTHFTMVGSIMTVLIKFHNDQYIGMQKWINKTRSQQLSQELWHLEFKEQFTLGPECTCCKQHERDRIMAATRYLRSFYTRTHISTRGTATCARGAILTTARIARPNAVALRAAHITLLTSWRIFLTVLRPIL